MHPKFIDRYMILLKYSHIPYLIVINKRDSKTKQEEEIGNWYRNLKVRVIETSTKTMDGMEELKEVLYKHQAVFVGHSGVGKSSLIQCLMNRGDIFVSSVSKKTKKGCHTTTHSTYYESELGFSIIDTPGIRSLSITGISVSQVQDYFREFQEFRFGCKYPDCIHYKEPECMVKRAVTTKKITRERYESYVKIVEELLNKKE